MFTSVIFVCIIKIMHVKMIPIYYNTKNYVYWHPFGPDDSLLWGLSCVVQDIQQYHWPLPTICQQQCISGAVITKISNCQMSSEGVERIVLPFLSLTHTHTHSKNFRTEAIKHLMCTYVTSTTHMVNEEPPKNI